jgi:hypothetical protein
MSLTKPKTEVREDLHEMYVGPDSHNNCFYCGEKFEENSRAITWLGTGDDHIPKLLVGGLSIERKSYTLLLHPPCALKLCTRLIRDVHEAECKDLIQITP